MVVNLHLYGLDLAMGGVLLPEHELAIIDEAHQLEDIISATSGVELTGGRFTDLARRVARRDRRRPARRPASTTPAGCSPRRCARTATRGCKGGLPDDLAGAITVARGRVESVLTAAATCPSDAPEETRTRALRLVQSAGALVEDLSAVEQVTANEVVWVEGTDANPMLRVAPLDVAELLQGPRSGTSAPPCSPAPRSRPGSRAASACPPRRSPSSMSAARSTTRRTRSSTAPPTSPTPGSPAYVEALTDELGDLIEAAGGRTLALFTSFRVLDEAAAALQLRLDVPILTQRDLPKGRLLEQFAADEATCLFATMGFWQGVDVPGASLSLVTIDRIPFPRPDEPLLQARRERAGCRCLRAHRPPPRRHPAGPGCRPPHPLRRRPRRRRRPRPPPGQGRLPLGHGARPPADASHQGPRRGAPRPRGHPGRPASARTAPLRG